MFAQIIVNRPIQDHAPAGSAPLRGKESRTVTFTYRLPVDLRDTARVGHLVQVPLGASTALGVIASLSDSVPSDLPSGWRRVSRKRISCNGRGRPCGV